MMHASRRLNKLTGKVVCSLVEHNNVALLHMTNNYVMINGSAHMTIKGSAHMTIKGSDHMEVIT